MENKEFLTIAELAKILGISRIAVFKKVQNGQIKAMKIGRNYAIPKKSLCFILGKSLSSRQKSRIDAAVAKTVREYGETLKLLGRE
jgi:excisionase family DNA binding protein